MSLIYIGCGSDFEPVIRFPEIKEFYYIDSLPRSQNGWSEYGTRLLSRPNYVFEFKRNIPPEFYKINIDESYPDVYHDCKNKRTIYHYYNLPFPWTTKIFTYHVSKHDIELLKFYISNATHLAVCGHSPHSEILDLLPKKFTLITNNNTFYPIRKEQIQGKIEESPSITDEFILSPGNQKRLKEVKHIGKNGVKTYENYVDFLINKC